jgi:hypothetical protein
MKLPAIVTGLLIATGVSLPACVAVAAPISAPPSLREAARVPIETVEQRRSRKPRGHSVAPSGYDDRYRAYGYQPGYGSDDWSHWSPSYHPGWPCVSGGRGSTGKSAYPSWEVGRGCR